MADDGEQRHGLADHLETLLPSLKSEWEGGSFSAMEKAFLWCAANGYKFPDWLLSAVREELAFSQANRPRGGTKKGNSVAHEREEQKHRLRFALMEQCLRFQEIALQSGQRTAPINEEEAAREVQKVLGGKHPAWGSTLAIKRSYKRLKAR